MTFSNISRFTLGAALVVILTACGGGSGGGAVSIGSGFDPGFASWYDVYGEPCSGTYPSPGCSYYSFGTKASFVDDRYADSFVLEWDTWVYIGSDGFHEIYTGWAWESPSGIIYDDWGRALNGNDSKGRDFAADVAVQEKNVVKTAAEFFSAKYGLDNQTGLKVARALKDWATIGKDRARTEKDIADFTQRLYGVDFNKVKGALAEAMAGDKGSLNGLVDEAATSWNTTPETMKEILKSWYGHQMDIL